MHSRQTLNLFLNVFKTNNIQCIQTFICQICIFIFLCFLILGGGPWNEWQGTLSLLGCMWGPNQPRYRDQLKLSKLAGLVNDSWMPAARQVNRVIIQPWVQLESHFGSGPVWDVSGPWHAWLSVCQGWPPGPLRFNSFFNNCSSFFFNWPKSTLVAADRL